MNNTLVYQDGSETIRQMPQNYLIAHKAGAKWICEPDLAADRELSSRVFNALFEFDNKYGSGLNLLSKVTPNADFELANSSSIDDVLLNEMNLSVRFISVMSEYGIFTYKKAKDLLQSISVESKLYFYGPHKVKRLLEELNE